jgi:hypothetical protein
VQQPPPDVVLAGRRGDEERRRPGEERPDRYAEVVGVCLGSGETRHQEVDPIAVALDAPLGLEAAPGRYRDVPLAPKDPAQVGSDVRLVVHDENGLANGHVAHRLRRGMAVGWLVRDIEIAARYGPLDVPSAAVRGSSPERGESPLTPHIAEKPPTNFVGDSCHCPPR